MPATIRICKNLGQAVITFQYMTYFQQRKAGLIPESGFTLFYSYRPILQLLLAAPFEVSLVAVAVDVILATSWTGVDGLATRTLQAVVYRVFTGGSRG